MNHSYLAYLENESVAEDRNGFVYKFHEKSVFDLERYHKFVENSKLFRDHYSENKTDIKFIRLRARLIDIFEYILTSFYCHYRENDLFEIKNILEVDDDIVDDIFSEFRKITGELLRYE